MTDQILPADLIARTQIIAGLRQLADYLTEHPDVPVCEFGWDVHFCTQQRAEAARRAEVDRIAAILGVAVADETGGGGHYIAAKTFGRITYQAICVPERVRAEHRALMSYAGVIVPGDPREAAL